MVTSGSSLTNYMVYLLFCRSFWELFLLKIIFLLDLTYSNTCLLSTDYSSANKVWFLYQWQGQTQTTASKFSLLDYGMLTVLAVAATSQQSDGGFCSCHMSLIVWSGV